MFCKLPRTVSSAHLSLLPASSFRNLLSLLLNRVTKRPVTELTGKTQAVLSPSTVKRFLEANKLPHKEGHHAALIDPDLSAVREGNLSDRLFINKTTGDWCALRASSTVSWAALVDRASAWSCCIPMHACAYVCVYVCVCVEHNRILAIATYAWFIMAPTPS